MPGDNDEDDYEYTTSDTEPRRPDTFEKSNETREDEDKRDRGERETK